MKASEIFAIDSLAVKAIFEDLESGNIDAFFEHVSEDVLWTVEGTHPLAGRYTSKSLVRERTFHRLASALVNPPKFHVHNILVSGPWAVVELTCEAVARNGLPFENQVCCLARFCGESIAEVRVYSDSAPIQRLLDGAS
jgi:ketosteroid isomerase-like protein